LGVVTALVLFAAVRRLVGSPWPGLVAAAFVLLNADQVYQEQYVGSEWLFTLLFAVGLYACVRAGEAASVPWAVAAGTLAALAVIVRTQGVLLIGVFAVAVLAAHPRPWRAWRTWRGALALLAAAGAILGAYGAAKYLDTGRFEIGPSPGWQLYAHVAPFADCRRFTPPPGTTGLCESIPPAHRAGHDHYLYDANSPAIRMFGHIGNDDGKVGAWALAVIEHQPGAYLRSVLDILRDYYVPSAYVPVPRGGYDLDADLDWNVRFDWLKPITIAGIERFFARFKPRGRPSLLHALHAYQRVFRLGGTLLTITTLLTLLGLAMGPRRARVGAFLFGVGALSCLLPQAWGAAYIGRYSVPLAGPLGAAAAIAVWELWRRRSSVAARGLWRRRPAIAGESAPRG
jgi:4-amino-4-deoxy-L-arabinose transferase-like glycosyltransferase